MEKEKFDAEVSPKTHAYVLKNDTINRRCNRCGSVVLKETNIIGYPFQCMSCDENMLTIETHLGNPHTDAELNELCIKTRDLLLLDE